MHHLHRMAGGMWYSSRQYCNRSSLEDGLATLWSRLEAGWAALVRGSGWNRDRLAYGLQGYVRIAEVVHHPTTGWNVH